MVAKTHICEAGKTERRERLPVIMRHVTWKTRLSADPEAVYAMLATAEGRGRFWAEDAVERGGVIHFVFSDGTEERSEILERNAPHLFRLRYFNSPTRFDIMPHEAGGSVLTVHAEDVPEEEHLDVHAGWVSVLMALKAALDFNIDLRNHSKAESWRQGFVEN